MTRICIFGAGAIGSHLAVRLAGLPEVDLSVVARGPQLQAIQSQGLRLIGDSEELQRPIAHATSEPAQLPQQDIVIVTLKAMALPGQAAAIARLRAADGVVLFVNNGIPWWWNYRGAASATPASLPLLDPDGQLWQQIGPEHVLAAVAYSPNEIIAPGVVRHRGHNRFVLGEPDQSNSARLQQLTALFNAAQLGAETSLDIRQSIWQKLLLNAAGNPICALTRLDARERVANPALLQLGLAVQQEIRAIASAMGWQLPPDSAPATGPSLHSSKGLNARPSMLQDALLGRAMEVDALLGQPLAFARAHGVSTPALDVIYPLLQGLNQAITAEQQAPESSPHTR